MPITLRAFLPDGEYPIVFDPTLPFGFYQWQVRAVLIGDCAPPDTESYLHLRCEDLGGGHRWWMYSSNFSNGPYAASFVSCDPFFLVFDGVDLSFCFDGASNETVVVTL